MLSDPNENELVLADQNAEEKPYFEWETSCRSSEGISFKNREGGFAL